MAPEQSPEKAFSVAAQPSWIAPVKPTVPDHELSVRIGGGSYGDVWLARSVVGTWRAVKVVFRDRFLDAKPYEREFSGIRKFEPLSRSNEGFIDILQIGHNEAQGYFYYVMELADDASGAAEIRPETYVPKTLAKSLLQCGRLPVGICLELGMTLNLALTRLHEAGLIHRDIKPSNIIFVGGVPKLADIGLVIEVAEARSYVGTEGFIPPEGPNSPQADVYSLGKVLYEAGMGKDRKDFPEPLTQIGQAPDSTELLEFNAILLKACAANLKDRYQSAGEMNADLALLQSGGSVRRQRTLSRRLRSMQRAGVAVSALAIVIGGGWLWQARQTRLIRDLANEKTRLAEEKTRLADENRERLVRLNIANGVRLLDQDDSCGSVLWFANTLPLVTNSPVEESIDRIRIQQVLNHSPRLLQVMTHDGNVQSGAFSPDGSKIATVTWKGEVRIWDVKTLTPVVAFLGLGNKTMTIRFSRDGLRLLVLGYTGLFELRARPAGFAVVLDAATGQPVFPAVTNLGRCSFSQDARWLAVVRANQPGEILDATTGQRLAVLAGHTDEISMLSFSLDGKLLASASLDRAVRLWRVPSGQPAGGPIRHRQPVARVAFSPDGRCLATAEVAPQGERNWQVHTWDVGRNVEVGAPIRAVGNVYCLTFDETTGRLLFIGDDARYVTVVNAESHLPAFPPLRFESSIERCWDFSPDGLRFAAGSDDGTVRVWSLETGEALVPRLWHAGWVESVRFSPDGRRLLTTSDDGTAKVWDFQTRADSKPLVLPASIPKLIDATDRDTPAWTLPRVAALRADRLLVGLEDSSIRSIDLRTLTEDRPPIAFPGEPAGAITFDQTGRQWAAAVGLRQGTNQSGVVGLWRQERGRLVYFALPHSARVKGIAFDSTGETLVTFSDKKAWMWNTLDGSPKREVSLPKGAEFRTQFGAPLDAELGLTQPSPGELRLFDLKNSGWVGAPFPDEGVNAFVLSPDRKRFATAGHDQCGHIWDVHSGQALTPAFKHGGDLLWIEWSPDGGRVLTAGLNFAAKVWDASNGELLLTPTPIGDNPMLIAHFSPDGRFVVARDNAHAARVWSASTGEPVTPILRFPTEVRGVMITARNRLVSISDPGVIQACDLVETKLPLAVIADYAHLLSGRKVDRTGVMLGLTAEEMGRLYHSLRSRAPELFAAP